MAPSNKKVKFFSHRRSLSVLAISAMLIGFVSVYNISKNTNMMVLQHTDHSLPMTVVDEEGVDLLIMMIDTRFSYFNDKSQGIKIEEMKKSYNWLTFCINYLYAAHYKYKLMVLDPNATDPEYACNAIYYEDKQDKLPINWCRVDMMAYYLSNESPIKFKYLIYLDADSHFIQFHVSFNQWISRILHSYGYDSHLIIPDDPPKFIEDQVPRLLSMMKQITEFQHGCTTEANTGGMVLRSGNISQHLVKEWQKSVNKVPKKWLHGFPFEQGAMNCYVTEKYAEYVRILKFAAEFNINEYYDDRAYVQHTTSLPRSKRQRLSKFSAFLNQLILSHKGGNTTRCDPDNLMECIPSTPNLNLSPFIDQNDDIDSVLMKCANLKHTTNTRKYGDYEFIEHLFE